jgi:hypothetical protein
MRPLSQPQINKRARFFTRQRKFLGIRDAINPNDTRTEPLSESYAKVSGGRTGCDDYVWLKSQ